MRILSSFKDYYDSMRCYAMCSNDFNYIRKTKKILLPDFKCNNFEIDLDEKAYNRNYTVNKFIIGFCGKYYQGFALKTDDGIQANKIIDYYYDYSVFTKYLNRKYLKKATSNPIRYSYLSGIPGKTVKEKVINTEKHWARFFNDRFKTEIQQLEKLNLFNTYNTPAFVITTELGYDYCRNQHNNCIINPDLSKYKFFKVFEGHYAYQELEMFLGSELMQNVNNAPQIVNDLVKIQQHGFDTKKSFRKAKTKRK